MMQKNGRRKVAALWLAAAAMAVLVAPVQAGYKKSLDKGTDNVSEKNCQVWAPSTFGQEEYLLRYTGGCASQRAEGKGRAEWLLLYANKKVVATWEGNFRNGVFIGDWPLKGKVEPIPGDAYLVEMGRVKGAALTFVASSPQNGPLDMCKPKRLILEADSALNMTDDAQVKAVMDEGIQVYKKLCAQRETAAFLVGVYDKPFQMTNDYVPNGAAEAHYAGAGKESEWSYYTNDAAEKARQDKRRGDALAAGQDAYKKFDAYSRQHGVAGWVTTQQLEENPFRWEGKTVGLCVQLERMLTRDTALVATAADSRKYQSAVQLRGVTPDFPESRYSVLLVAKVGKREAKAGGSGSKDEYTTLEYVDSRRSERARCDDWLNWGGGGTRLVWDAPYPGSNP